MSIESHEKCTNLTPAGDFVIVMLSHPMGEGVEEENSMKHESSLVRLKTVEGHIKGIIRMVENDEYCIDVIRQIQAVQAALNKVTSNILDEHLNSCVITAIRGDDPVERERVLKEIAEIYEQAAKV